ncbi:MAG TPA: hypothetical protein VGE01_03080 [Fimbriimonas sp.]
MPNKLIYVIQSGEKDYSRWLNFGVRPTGEVTIYLSDCCHPGRVSSLKTVSCDHTFLVDSLKTGAVQIVTTGGYFLARREDDAILVEFRGTDDSGPTKVEVRADEVMSRLEELACSISTVPE